MTHLVGVKSGRWLFITDESEIFTAEEDVRHYSEPPGSNRIKRFSMTVEKFREYCLFQNIELRGRVTGSEKLDKAFAPAAIAGGIGALIGGPVGAALGTGILGWLSSNSDFEPERLAEVFLGAKEKCKKWDVFEIEHKKIKAKEAADYEQSARESWHRYHRLRNLASVDTLDGREFEAAIRVIYEKMGYMVTLTPATGDFGVDVIAEKGNEKLAIQAKRYSGTVGIKAVQEAASGAFYYKANKAVVITNSFYTPKAKELANELGVDLINRKRLSLMWEKLHQDDSMPPFNLKSYEEMKREISHELRHVDFAARTDKRKYPR